MKKDRMIARGEEKKTSISEIYEATPSRTTRPIPVFMLGCVSGCAIVVLIRFDTNEGHKIEIFHFE